MFARGRIAIATLIAVAICAVPSLAAAEPDGEGEGAEYASAFRIAEAAYQYGLPLLDVDRTFRTLTSVNVPDGQGAGPVNRFNHVTTLVDASERVVVAPNNDTLYSMGWVDLGRGPVVVHSKPGTRRFHVLEMLDPYEKNFANIGSRGVGRKDGSYLLARYGWSGRAPEGMKVIRSRYNLVWILGRTEIRGQSDLKRVRRIQRTYRLVPFRHWNPRHPYAYHPPRPKHVDRTRNDAHVPGTGPGEDPATFFDALGDQLERFPPPPKDRAIVKRMRRLGIGPGLHPTTSGDLDPVQLKAMRDAVTSGPATLTAHLLKMYKLGFERQNGWLGAITGRYGNNYLKRAAVDKFGLGAPVSRMAMYPIALMDRTGAFLTGAKRYVVHFSRATAHPPVRAFWSMTMYEGDGYFVDNPLDRYLINDRSNLEYNRDGSLDVYIQPERPSKRDQVRNWLPSPPASAPTQRFRLMTRLYGLSKRTVHGIRSGKGWRGPTILPCGPGNETSTGIPCAD